LERGLELLELEPTRDHGRRADLLLALAQARREIGDSEGSREASLAAAEAARAIGSAERLARAAQVYWTSAGTNVRDATVPALCEEALEALGEAQPALRARLLARLTHYRSSAESQGFALAEQADEALALARESGDPDALAATLRVSIRLRVGSGRVGERLPLADELIELGEANGDHRSVLIALGHRVDADVELADRARYDADLGELQRRAGELDMRLAKHLIAVAGSTRALMEGRFDEVPRLSAEALALSGLRADALQAHPGRMAQFHREQGRLDDALAAGREFAAQMQGHPLGLARLAQLQAESGDPDAANVALQELAADDFAAVPRDVGWPATLSWLAEVCARLHDPNHAPDLYEQLLPHGGHLVTIGGPVCLGAADRFLGMLAATLGRLDDAEAHYRTALELEDRMKAAPLAARTRYWYARTLLARDASGDAGRATELLQTAHATAEELCMAALAADVEGLLRSPRSTAAGRRQIW
jgi:tetratricopeptide (TPR) repeat protein